MLCRVLNCQGVSVACAVFLGGRANEEGGSGRGVHDRMSAEVDNEWKQRLAADFRMVNATQSPAIGGGFAGERFFCAHKVGLDVSILICVRCAVFFL